MITRKQSEHETTNMRAGHENEIRARVSGSAPRPEATRGLSWSWAKLVLAGALLALIIIAGVAAPWAHRADDDSSLTIEARRAIFMPKPTPDQLRIANEMMVQAFARMARDRARESQLGAANSVSTGSVGGFAVVPASPTGPAATPIVGPPATR